MREPCAARSPGVRCGLPQDGSTVLGEVAGAVDRDGTTRRSAVLDGAVLDGSELIWHTDYSVTGAGFKICAAD